MKTIAWNVDTQFDFMRKEGKLYVRGAEAIEPTLEKLTDTFRKTGTKIINTADWHLPDSEELSVTPDYVRTFPEHCMQNTEGAKYVPATMAKNAYVVGWQDQSYDIGKLTRADEIVLLKDRFDVFSGNPHAGDIVDRLSPDRAIVYGVATNVCVDFAVRGLLEKGVEVYVVKDAIMGLPGIPSPIDSWKESGARMIGSDDVRDYLTK